MATHRDIKPERHFFRTYWQWFAIGVAFLLTFVAGWIGFWQYYDAKEIERSLWDITYVSLQLFTLESGAVEPSVPHLLECARFIAPFVALGAVLKFCFDVLRERFDWFRRWRYRDHVIICGLGRKAFRLASDLRTHRKKVVVLEQDAQNDLIPMCRDMGTIVLVGDAREDSLLQKAGIDRAQFLIAMCGDDQTNVETAVHSHRLVQNEGRSNGTPLRCFAEVFDLRLCRLLREHEDLNRAETQFELALSNSFEQTARALWEKYPLDGTGGISADSSTQVHLVVVGFGALGQSVALQAAKTAHYANFKPLRLTVIDRLADQCKNSFYSRFPQFDKTCQSSYVGYEADEPRFLVQMSEWALEENTRMAVVVCLDDESDGFFCALNLASWIENPDVAIFVRSMKDRSIETFMEMACSERSERCDQSVVQTAGRIIPFGSIDEWCNCEWLIGDKQDRLAKAVHNQYVQRIRERANGGEVHPVPDTGTRLEIPSREGEAPAESPVLAGLSRPESPPDLESTFQQGAQQQMSPEEQAKRERQRQLELDASTRPWNQLSHDFRESNRQVADHISIKLRAIGCVRAREERPEQQIRDRFTDQDEITLLARMEHQRWCADRYLAGWRSGPVKDARHRINPNLAPWDELDEVDRQLGRAAGSTREFVRQQVSMIPTLLKEVGEKVYRTTRE